MRRCLLMQAFFGALPSTFMPAAAVQVCEVCVPSVSSS